jgi:hypothetical protein
LALTLSPASSCYNRFFHALSCPPRDLAFEQSRANIATALATLEKIPASGLSVVAPGLAYHVTAAAVPRRDHSLVLAGYALTWRVPVFDGPEFIQNRPPGVLLGPSPRDLYTPASFCGFLSQHWSPQRAAFEHMGAPEFEEAVGHRGFIKAATESPTYYRYRF